MKNSFAFFGRQARQFQFLERGSRHGGNLRPMRCRMRRDFSRFAQFSVGRVVIELQGEQHQGHSVEFSVEVRQKVGVAAMFARKITGADGKFRCHAVFLRAGFPPQPREIFNCEGLYPQAR